MSTFRRTLRLWVVCGLVCACVRGIVAHALDDASQADAIMLPEIGNRQHGGATHSLDTVQDNKSANTFSDNLDVLGLTLDVAEKTSWPELAAATFSNIVSRILTSASTSDFTSFNELFQNAKIHLPDEKLVQQVVFNEFILDVSNVICYNVRLEDLAIDYATDANASLTVNATMQVSMDCDMDYWYGFGSVQGAGSLIARTSRNRLESTLQVTSGGEGVPPSVSMNACYASVDIIDLSFDGGVVARIADILQKMIASIVEKQVSTLVCDQLSGIGATMLKDAIANLNKRMSKYLKPVPYNPLKLEHKTDFGPNILNLQAETGLGSLISIAIRQLDSFLSGQTSDIDGPTGTGSDLTLNVMMRDRLLSQDRAFDVNVSAIANPIILDRSDKVTDTVIVIDSVKVYGLDTLRAFSGFDLIGNRTLQSTLAWEYLTVEIDMTVTMTGSTQADSIIEGTLDREVVEKIRVMLGVDKLDVAVSLLLAVNEDQLGTLQLGSLLFSEQLVSCLLSALDDVVVTTLNVVVADIRDPTIEGFVSPGFDRVISQLVKAALAVYEPTLLRAIPTAFQVLVRNTINEQFLPEILSSASCMLPTVVDEFVDLRDLLLPPATARIRGGTGEQQYGDIGHLLYQAVQDTFMAPGSDGSAGINAMLMRPMTLAQSGSAGLLRFASKLVSVERTDVGSLSADRLEFSLSDFQVENVDTLRAPLSLLQPTDSPFESNNTMRVGNLFRDKLTASVRLLLAVHGDSSPIRMSNEVLLSATANSVTMGAIIESMLLSETFAKFQMQYIMDGDCWLSMFPSRATEESALQISSFVASLASFTMNATCTACSSSGATVLPDLINIISGSKSFPVLARGIEAFAHSYAEDGPMNSMFGQMIRLAHQRCPMSSLYDASAEKAVWKSELQEIPGESVDAVVFAAGLAAEIGLTVFGVSHATPHKFQDALSAQTATEMHGDVKLLDWTDLETSLGVGKLPDFVFREVRTMLTRADGAGNLPINSLLENSLLADGIMTFDPKLGAEKSGMVARLDLVEISGLNTFTAFDVLKPIAPQTLQNTIKLESIGFRVLLSIGPVNGALQHVSVSFNATDISIDLSVFAAFDLERLGSIKMETFFGMASILPCLLSSTKSFQIPRFIVDAGSVSRPRVEGLHPATAAAMSSSINAIADRYGANLTAAIPFISDGVVKGIITSMVNDLISTNSACDTTSLVREAPLFVDFRDLLLTPARSRQLGGSGLAPYGSLFQKLYELLQERLLAVDSESGLSKVNDGVVSKMTETQSGSAGRLEFPDPFSSNTRINVGGLDAKVLLRMFDAYLDDVDTIGAPMSLLAPVAGVPDELNSSGTIGVGPSLRAGGRFVFGLASDDMDIFNDLSFLFSIDDLSVVANALIQLDDAAFRTFPIRDALNQYCWLAAIPAQPLDAYGVRLPKTLPSLSLLDLNAWVALLKLNITCMDCSSPGMAELAQLVSTPAATASLTKSVNNLLGYISRLLGGAYLQNSFDRILVESQRRCPHVVETYEAEPAPTQYKALITPEEGGSVALFLALALTVITISLAVWFIIFAIRFIVRRRHRRWLHQQSSSVIHQTWCLQVQRQRKEQYIDEATTSLFTSHVIPRWVRLSMPFCILANIGLFISGHLNVAATVTIVASVAEQTVQAANFYEFSIARSTIEIWKAGGKALAMLILIVSGIWPYTKQIITMVLWFAPTRLVSVSRRGSILLWFDVLAKWSFVDIFVLVVTVAGFRVSVHSPSVDFLPNDFYSLDLLVVPLWGLYANLIAQMVSQISSHFIIHYHRKVIEDAERAAGDNCGRVKNTETGLTISESASISETWRPTDDGISISEDGEEALNLHAFSRPHRGGLDRLTVRDCINRLMIALGALVTLLVVLGCALPVVSQNVLGIIGLMVESGQDFDNATSSYSLFSIIGMLFAQAKFTGRAADYIGLGSLSIVLVSCVLIVPIVQTGALLLQWFRPMTAKQRRRWSIAIECLEAWQYCEVFLLAVVVAAWQLGPVSEFMVGSSCEALTDTFAQLVYYGLLKAEDAQCFRVDSLVAPGAFILAAGALLLTLLNVFVRMAIDQYMKDTQVELPLPFDRDSCVESDAEMIDQIEPGPILFTDRFRWAMTSKDGAWRGSADESAELRKAKPGAADASEVLSDDDPSRSEDSYSISPCASQEESAVSSVYLES